jgi:hypothetical protein
MSRGLNSPQAWSFLGDQTAGALSVAGRIGSVASGIGIGVDLYNGQWTSAFYDTVDFGVYWGLGAVGTAGAMTTAGTTLAATGTAAVAYTLNGGSKGMAQSLLCN